MLSHSPCAATNCHRQQLARPYGTGQTNPCLCAGYHRPYLLEYNHPLLEYNLSKHSLLNYHEVHIATPARLCPSAISAQTPQQAQPPSYHTTPLLLLAAAGRRLSAAACKAGALAWPAAFAVAHALQPPCLLHAEHTKRPTLAAANIIRSVQRWLLTPLLHAAVASTPAALPVLLLWAVAWWPPALLLASRPAARRADSIPECPGAYTNTASLLCWLHESQRSCSPNPGNGHGHSHNY